MKETFLDSQQRVMFIKELIQYQVIIKNQSVKINIEHNWESRNGKPGMFGLGMTPRETFWPFKLNFSFFDNKTCTWKRGHGRHWCILWSLPLLLLLLIFVSFFFFFIELFPITIDLVFTFLYHVTLEYDFWYGDSFYPFFL